MSLGINMSFTGLLNIENLKVSRDDKEILKGVNLSIDKGEIHVIMGPNGAGKSTLAYALMGHPQYKITEGSIIYKGENINPVKVDQRARKGIFLSFQYPEEIPGVTVENFLRTSKNFISGKNESVFTFSKKLNENMEKLKMNSEYSRRYLNVGFSGGEKKKNEILQMITLQPSLVILDETDSGLDIDALKIVANGVREYSSSENAILIITHYNKLLSYIKPDYVHILENGIITRKGDISLADEIEENGFSKVGI